MNYSSIVAGRPGAGAVAGRRASRWVEHLGCGWLLCLLGTAGADASRGWLGCRLQHSTRTSERLTY
jgi:hypothetical protein